MVDIPAQWRDLVGVGLVIAKPVGAASCFIIVVVAYLGEAQGLPQTLPEAKPKHLLTSLQLSSNPVLNE